jgi:hypothetical protein
MSAGVSRVRVIVMSISAIVVFQRLGDRINAAVILHERHYHKLCAWAFESDPGIVESVSWVQEAICKARVGRLSTYRINRWAKLQHNMMKLEHCLLLAGNTSVYDRHSSCLYKSQS